MKKLVISLALATFVLSLLRSNSADYDLWHYLAFGRLFWGVDGFPYQDIFAYVPTKKMWVYHEWLTGALYFPIYQALGGAGLQLMKYVLGLMTAGFIYLASRKRGGGPLAAVLGLFIAKSIFSSFYSPVRAQVFTFLFLAISIYILESAKRDERWVLLWWLIPIQLLWCNFHGGFVAGLGVIGLYALGESLSHRRFWPYVKVLVFSALVTLINPYGIKYWEYLVEAILMPRPEIWEWFSVYTAIKKKILLFTIISFVSVFIVSSMFVLWYRKRDLTDLLVLSTTAYLSFQHIRHVSLFMLCFAVYLPVIFSNLWEVFRDHPWKIALGRHLGGKAPIFLIVVLSLFFSYKFLSASPFDIKFPSSPVAPGKGPYYPVGAVEYMKTHNLTGNVLSEFAWGQFIFWTFYPDSRVAMDGRYETVYPKDLCEEYFDFIKGRDNWRTFLNKYPHEIIVIRSNSKTRKLLQNEPGWREEYSDATSVLLLKEKEKRP